MRRFKCAKKYFWKF